MHLSTHTGIQRVAIVSDQLFTYGGAERVLEHILALYPHATVFALVDFLPPEARSFLGSRTVHTTFLQNLPLARKYFRILLDLWPIAIERLNLSGFDLVLSSHHSVAHGALTGPYQLHLSYTHSPMRYIWDLQDEYLAGAHLRGPARWWAVRSAHLMRIWDFTASQRVNQYAANSHFVAGRIRQYYGKPATVVYPPIDVENFALKEHKIDYYVTVARLTPYKRVDVIIRAFNRMRGKRLVVIGNGPQLRELKRLADGNGDIQFTGHIGFERMRELVSGARAFVYAGIEDFGIAPLEAQACGTPVIALKKGGLAETIRGPEDSHPTGILFEEQTAEKLVDAVHYFERGRRDISPLDCRANALQFSSHAFRQNFSRFVVDAVNSWEDSARQPARDGDATRDLQLTSTVRVPQYSAEG